MAHPKNKIKLEWSPDFAYAIGLITTDGNLSANKKYITLVSNDRAQIENFKKCLDLKNKIGRHVSGSSKKVGFRIQFGDVNFYKFLLDIGLTPKKSKTIGPINVPDEYFFDFLRGHLDGDGSFHSYWDKRWRSSFMFYTYFYSASKKHIFWLQQKITKFGGISGYITKPKAVSVYALRYAKFESLKLLTKIYSSRSAICLSRKYLKIKKALGIIGKQDII